MTARIGSLFSGYGGLDLAVSALTGAEVAWHCEWEDAPAAILDRNFPGVPNYRDVSKVDWSSVEPVDILTGGFPCQDVSLAGRRAGMNDTSRSGLWSEFAKAIDVLRPELVVIENVRGLLSATAESDVERCAWCLGDDTGEPALRALGAVLGDLADLGYDAEWVGVRAADAGAPHNRFRVFILAHPKSVTGSFGYRDDVLVANASGGRSGGWPEEPEQAGGDYALVGSDSGGTGSREYFVADAAHLGHEWGWASWGRRDGLANVGEPVADASGERLGEHPGTTLGEKAGTQRGDLATSVGRSRADSDGWPDTGTTTADPNNTGRGEHGGGIPVGTQLHPAEHTRDDVWGDYAPAIHRWETVTGRTSPNATEPDGRDGQHRLSACFVEWMMGLPEGWVTDPAIGISRNNQLKALGNGVVPQQAHLALQMLGVGA